MATVPLPKWFFASIHLCVGVRLCVSKTACSKVFWEGRVPHEAPVDGHLVQQEEIWCGNNFTQFPLLLFRGLPLRLYSHALTYEPFHQNVLEMLRSCKLVTLVRTCMLYVVCMYVCMYVCMCVCVCVCVCVCAPPTQSRRRLVMSCESSSADKSVRAACP
jgi:hypothetical protein